MKKNYLRPKMEYWAFQGAELCVTTNPLKLGRGRYAAPAPPVKPGSGGGY